MPSAPIDIEMTLSEVNDRMLLYFLRQYRPPSQNQIDGSLASEARRISRASSLEKKIRESLAGIFEDDGERVWVSRNSMYDVIYYASEAAEKEGNPEQGILALKALKERIVRFNQDGLLHYVRSHLSVISSTYNAVLEDPDLSPLFRAGAGSHLPDSCIEDFITLIKTGPMCFEEYMEKVKAAVDRDDLATAGLMVHALQENMISSSLHPTGFNEDSSELRHAEQLFGPKYAYAKMLIKLEEMQVRLSNLRRVWPGIVEQVFRKDHRDDLSLEEGELDVLRMKIMRPDLLITLDSDRPSEDYLTKKGSFESTVINTALKGPLHLSLAQGFVEQCISDIKREVFSIGAAPVDQKLPGGYIIVIEPRAFRGIEPEKTRVYGFTPEDISSFGDTAYGIVSTYLRIPLPLRKVEPDEKVSAAAEQYRGRLLHADKTVVIDLYGEGCSLPPGLVSNIGKPCLQSILAGTPVPSEGLQVVIKYDVHLLDDLTIAAEAPIKIAGPDGRKVIDYRIRRKDKDLGEHTVFIDYLDTNPDSRMMTRAEFDKWKKGK